jgi:acetyl-CoA C-acetyltransferase
MKGRIAIIDGLRSPMGRMNGALDNIQADNLATHILHELHLRNENLAKYYQEVIFGNVSGPAHAANIARVIALKAGISKDIPAFSVHRNCASGMEAVTSAIAKIQGYQDGIYVVGGVESMSNIPFLFSKKYQMFLTNFARCKSIPEKLLYLTKFRFSFFAPTIALKLGLTDPVCNMIMGDTAELLAREFKISRKDQDEFAMQSHNKAEKARDAGIYQEESIPFPANPKKGKMLEHDEGIRDKQNMNALGKLKPFFDRNNGSVTAGNSSQLTDGASCMLISSEKFCKDKKIKPIAYIKDFAYAGLEGERMGLGPVYAINKILKRNKLTLKNIDLFEINEAFAAQVIACLKALNSKEFCKDKLGRDKEIGEIPLSKLNVNGGAIALGHPVGMTGNRIILHLAKELKRRNLKRGIASLCIGGGQGGAVLIEV